MRSSLVRSIGVILLAALAFCWSELYLPLDESLQVDILKLADHLQESRRLIDEWRHGIPGLAIETELLGDAVAALTDRFESAFTDDLYLAINTETNLLYMRRGRRLIHEAVISTGRRDTLKHESRKWIFDTPRGVLTVWRKKKDPVWIKPDWAFLEKGDSVPSFESPLRRQDNVLGAYLLDLGGGLAIHGTQAVRQLGRSVTHGCIRVGAKDLKVFYDSVPVGTKVYIY